MRAIAMNTKQGGVKLKDASSKKQTKKKMNQTYGGMQPWHEMQKVRNLDVESDDGIFSRHKE